MKFIHTADIHLGAQFLGFGSKGKILRDQTVKTFENIIDFSIKSGIDVLLIAGDIFDKIDPEERYINIFRNGLRKLSENSIYTVVIPGTHDRLDKNSIFEKWKSIEPSAFVYIFNSDTVYYYIPSIETVFYANPNIYSKSSNSPLSHIERIEKGKYHIALAHGSFQIPGKSAEDDYPISLCDIKDSEMDYIALGHWHSVCHIKDSNIPMYYSGSPEISSAKQIGRGSVILGELEQNSKQFQIVPIGKYICVSEKVVIGKYKTYSSIVDYFQKRTDDSLILNLEIVGINDNFELIDQKCLKKDLEEIFFYVNITDNSVFNDDTLSQDAYPEGLVLGNFIKKVNSDTSLFELEKQEILKYGINLLKGRKVL